MIKKASSITLRQRLAKLDKDLASLANLLWKAVKPIQERQSKRDGMINGPSHCETVESNALKLITDSNKTLDFNATELFILSCAAACHDLDKGLEEGLKPTLHGKVSGEFVRKLGENMFGPFSVAIDHIIKIHNKTGKKYLEAHSKIPNHFPIGTKDVDLPMLALLLKAGDVLDTTESRVDKNSEWETQLSGLKLAKYRARKCTYGWYVNGSRIVFSVNPQDNVQEKVFVKCFKWMHKEEWAPIADALGARGFPNELDYKLLRPTPKKKAAKRPTRGTGDPGTTSRPKTRSVKPPKYGVPQASRSSTGKRRPAGGGGSAGFSDYRKKRIEKFVRQKLSNDKFGQCSKTGDEETCPLRPEALSLLAELARTSEAMYETQQLVLRLTRLYEIASEVSGGVKGTVKADRVDEFVWAIEHVFDLFAKEIERDYKHTWSAPRRLREFVTLRLQERVEDGYVSAVVDALEHMHRTVQARSFLGANDAAKMKALGKPAFLRELRRFKNGVTPVITGLYGVAKSRGSASFKKLSDHLEVADFSRLGDTFQDANGKLPHNMDHTLRLWPKGFRP